MNYAGCKVEMIVMTTAKGLEKEINNFLEDAYMKDFIVHDICYQYAKGGFDNNHSAMIVYSK